MECLIHARAISSHGFKLLSLVAFSLSCCLFSLSVSFAFLLYVVFYTSEARAWIVASSGMSSEEPEPAATDNNGVRPSPRRSPKKMTVHPSNSEAIPLKEINNEPSKTVRVSESYEDAIEKPGVAVKGKWVVASRVKMYTASSYVYIAWWCFLL